MLSKQELYKRFIEFAQSNSCDNEQEWQVLDNYDVCDGDIARN